MDMPFGYESTRQPTMATEEPREDEQVQMITTPAYIDGPELPEYDEDFDEEFYGPTGLGEDLDGQEWDAEYDHEDEDGEGGYFDDLVMTHNTTTQRRHLEAFRAALRVCQNPRVRLEVPRGSLNWGLFRDMIQGLNQHLNLSQYRQSSPQANQSNMQARDQRGA